ncbi:hypothetical protein [Piscinibacter defluvii]|uniref:hypothetical protein n=1 Tax=Piscinibacter defluvii TaxID=1796922 RepID=UPI000FDF3770|nr:hypothetical protein [Piscinibacter defluvii]
MSTGWPALTVELPPSRAWRAGIDLLAVLACLALAAWWWLGAGELTIGWRLAGAVLGTAAIVAAWGLRAAAGARLRWDGRAWWLARRDRPPIEGRLVVALDLGAWMLLRFDAEAPSARHWIPAGRADLAGQWHDFRCAVYSARPAPGGSSAAASPAPDE